MDKVTIHISANEQLLTSAECPLKVASNTVSYIEAVFELGENWTGYDSVRAVWSTYMDTIATVLDSEGKCVVPHEVMTRTQKVFVNLVGSVVEDDELTDRLTTYPILAVVVNADALVEGTETAPITPSQFEQFVNEVSEEVSKIKDIVSTTLNDDYTLTFVFSDGTETTVGPIRGEQGPQGETGPQGPEGPPGEVTLATLESLMPTDTASGAIASFPDGQSVFPLKSLIAEISPIQDLHGYDSPWVGGAGKNKANIADGSITSSVVIGSVTLNSGTYTASIYAKRNDGNQWRLRVLDNGTLIDTSANMSGSSLSRATVTFTLTETKTVDLSPQFLSSYDTIVYEKAQVESGSTATEWTPYSNICPISGWNSVGVVDCGVNFIDKTKIVVGERFNASGTASVASSFARTELIKVKPSTDYYFTNVTSSNTWSCVWWYDEYGRNISWAGISGTGTVSGTKTSPANAYYVGINIYASDINTTMLTEGTTAPSSYIAYNGTTYTTSLGTTVYGGTLDVVSGVLTIDRYYGVGINWSQYNTSNGYIAYRVQNLPVSCAEHYSTPTMAQPISNMVAEFGTFSSSVMDKNIIQITAQDQTQWTYMALKADANPSDVQLCYKLATPTTIQLTPTQVQTLLGTNNIFADSGDVSVEYVADIQGYIDKQ